MLRGWELTRLLTMIAFLAVLGMVIYQTSRIGGDEQAGQAATAAPVPADPKAPKTPDDSTVAKVVSSGPTDEDPEQRVEAENEFQAVTDGSLGVQREEMFAYWRLFTWIEHQSMETLQRRAASDVTYNDLMMSPDKYRGRLVRLDLNVRRVLSCDPPEDGPAEIKKVYEIWGLTDDSKAWLYDVLTAHLPEGMPVGPDVEDRATFVGYFLKLQGYHEGVGNPRAAPLRAPLLIGRLVRTPRVVAQAGSQSYPWLLAAAGGVILLVAGGAVLGFILSRRQSHQRPVPSYDREAFDQMVGWGEAPAASDLSDGAQLQGNAGAAPQPTPLSSGNHHRT